MGYGNDARPVFICDYEVFLHVTIIVTVAESRTTLNVL